MASLGIAVPVRRDQTVATLRAERGGRRGVRLHAQGTPDLARRAPPYLTLELRDSTGSIRGARVPRRRRARRALRARRARARARARGALPRGAADRRPRDRARRRGARPTRRASCRVAYRDLDELEGFLEHLAREVYDPAAGGAARARCSATRALRAELRRAPCSLPVPRRAARRGGSREPSRLPRRAARAHGRGRHDGARAVHAAPAPRPRPAAERRDRPRPRQDARVHLRRARSSAARGAAARATSSSACASSPSTPRRRSQASAGSRSSTACCSTTAPTPPPAALRLGRGARAVPPERARRPGQGALQSGLALPARR